MEQDRLKYKAGDMVQLHADLSSDGISAIYTVVRVEPALEKPYFLTDNNFHAESELIIWSPPERTWDDMEADIKRVANQLRELFRTRDAAYMNLDIKIKGRPDGDLKVEYKLSDSEYGSDVVKGYSLDPVVSELFRRKQWDKRNAPALLSYSGDEQQPQVSE